jgi:hypothetical protein
MKLKYTIFLVKTEGDQRYPIRYKIEEKIIISLSMNVVGDFSQNKQG